ncbi:hypothetical protein RJT34_07566 [Clitoria ternatea]|uniref:Uncharacterized protein n=1 Tax=Clitoria ternatea TaxID=43366 RepID=A0AAN9K6P7_CLITE
MQASAMPCRLLLPQSLLPPSSTPTPSVPSSHPAPSLRPCLPSDSLTLFVPPLRPSLPSTPRSLRPCLPSVPCLPSSPAFPSTPSLPLNFSLSRTTIFLRFTHSRGLKLPPLKGCLWWLWWLLPVSFKLEPPCKGGSVLHDYRVLIQ